MEEVRALDLPIDGKPCREHPQLAGACFDVRGRLNLWSGRPTVRIWEVGTERIFGVAQHRFKLAGYINVSRELVAELHWGTHVFADFTLCPFTQPGPGYLQLVCIDAAKNVDVQLDGFLQNR